MEQFKPSLQQHRDDFLDHRYVLTHPIHRLLPVAEVRLTKKETKQREIWLCI